MRTIVDLPVARERGWALVIVLVALAIVAFLARDAIRAWIGGATPVARPASGDARAPDAVQAAPAPAAPVERAREVEATVLKQADDLRQRVDGATR